MRPRAHLAGGALPNDPRRQCRDVEPEHAQHMLEQQVLLEAVAAAAVLHELALERIEIEQHGSARERIEVLEWNGLRVALLQAAQRVEGRGTRPRVADAFEVGIEVEHFGTANTSRA